MEENIFGKRLKDLRERHFPGESLRRVGKRLEKDFGEYFYTQLSKMEGGYLLPSEGLLGKISSAYGLSREEFTELLMARNFQKAHEIDVSPEALQTAGQRLFRKSKKKNP